jgi:hypothetical protein
MMISADVALHNEWGKDYLSIEVTPHPFAIACEGKYYKRSGSITIELTGNVWSEFLLHKQGLNLRFMEVSPCCNLFLCSVGFIFIRLFCYNIFTIFEYVHENW